MFSDLIMLAIFYLSAPVGDHILSAQSKKSKFFFQVPFFHY